MSNTDDLTADADDQELRSLARLAARKVLSKDRNDRPGDPRHPAFASEYIAECDRLLAATPALLQEALENAGYAAEGQNVDPFQGIVEVMQNADDRRAREVRVRRRSLGAQRQMLIVHDGDAVEYEHVLAMLLPFVSTKRDDADQRGRFGIGLKTLRRIARDIQVHGAPYHFGSGDGVSILEHSPEPAIPDFYDPAADTLLVLDLEEDFSSEAFESWANAWTEDGLVFLEHLRRFRCRVGGDEDLLRETRATGWQAAQCDGANVQRLEHRTVRAGPRSYSIYRAHVPVPADQNRFHKQTSSTTAISVATSGRTEDTGLFVGFRTRIATRLNVLLDAQFDPTSSREGIQDNKWNRWLVTKVGEALGQSAAAAFAASPRTAWRFVPVSGEGVTSAGWPAAEIEAALEDARMRVAALARFGAERDVPMSALAYEAESLTGLITVDDVMALAPGTLALASADRDPPGRWRAVLDTIGVSREIEPADVLANLDADTFVAREPAWWVSLADCLTEHCPADAVMGAPLWVCEGEARVAARAAGATHRKIVAPAELPPLAKRRRLFDVLHAAFQSEAGLRATTWLKDNAAFAERVSARDELLSFAEAYGDAPITLADEELREIRDLLDPVTGHAAFEIGTAVGRAILLEAADGGAKGARSWRRPAEVYLPKAIDKDNPNWPNAAAGLTGLHWVVASYEDRLRTGLGRQKFRPDGARSRGARNFLMLLGCEVGPRLVVGAEPNRRSARRQASMTEARASSIPKDVLSPDLERVLRAILDTHRPKRERRDRALALLRTLSRDWNRRLRDAASVEGWHEARVYRHLRGRHTAHWLDRLQETAWIPVGRERFRLPGEAAIRTPETQAMYRTEDFVAGLAADEIDADFAQTLGLTAHARVSDIVALLEEMRDGVQPFDLTRIRLVYQQLARVAPRGWSPMIGDLSVHTFRARFNSGAGLVLVIAGNGSADWRRPGQVRRGRQVLPDRELYVIDDSFRALWSLLHVGETNLEDCCEYLRDHAARVGPTEEDGLLIQVYRYMAGLLGKDGAVPSPSVRHVPLACTQDWRARRPILLVENADLRARLAAARPEFFFWRPPCDTRSLGALVDALSVTRLAPAVRPLSDQRSQEAGEDLTETFRAAVDHLSDTLGRASAGVRSALLVAWDELKSLKLFVYDDIVPVEVTDPQLGAAVSTSLRAHLRRSPLELHANVEALGLREEVGALIADLFDAAVEYPYDGEWALAWQAAKRSAAAALRFATDDAAHAAKVAATAAQVAANAGAAVKLKGSTSAKAGKPAPSSPFRKLKTVQPGIVSVSIIEGEPAKAPKPPTRPNLKRRRKPSAYAEQRAPNTDYTNGQLEDFGWDVVVHVLQRGDGPELQDFRRRHHVGADGAFDWEEFVELKAAGRSMQTSVMLSASEFARALERGNDYILALVHQCEQGSQTRVKLVFDPARRAQVRETEGVRLSGLDTAPGVLVELGEDGGLSTPGE